MNPQNLQPEGATPDQRRWWKEAVIYQIYPPSFLDTDGDGIGNIQGITKKLDYLKDLGIDVVWLTPVYDSPQKDMGYDIADYYSIYKPYGTMEDLEELIAEVKKREMKIVMDLVVNHTSDQHPWFKDSASSTDSKHKDFYIWKKPKIDEKGERQPPNNWACILDEAHSAWTYCPARDEYFLSLFSPYQPDLNWECENVRKEVHKILEFWIAKGVDGFRMDVINLISKRQTFEDADITDPSKPFQNGAKHFATGPRLKEYLQEMKREVLSKYDLLTVGEMPFLHDEDQILDIVQADEGMLNMIFTFDLMMLDDVPGQHKFSWKPWSVRDLSNIIEKMRRVISRNGWKTLYLENHDQPRSISRFCDDSDQHRVASAKLLCIMQTTLTGTLYIYQGEELGMRNIPPDWPPEEYKDFESVQYFEYLDTLYERGTKEYEEQKELVRRKARDNPRTPMQWDSSPNGGFCPAGVKPWMRVNDDYTTCNAAAQLVDPRADDASKGVSVYRFWQRALQMRKNHFELFFYGHFEVIKDTHPAIFAYKRRGVDEVSVTVLNFSGHPADFELPSDIEIYDWALGSYDALTTEKARRSSTFDIQATAEMSARRGSLTTKARRGTIKLRPWEGLLGVGVEIN